MDVGNYTLGHLLGRGGTSEVYAARHRERGNAVAVKLVQTAAGVDLVAEAMRVRDIHHPNVVRIIEVGNDAASRYLVMELIEGETLAARLRRGPIAEPELRELGAAIADGMQAAHARGIVHRDLKPGNVMLRGDDPVIVDFGIAKSLGASTAAVTERRVGTVAYMAPEQLVDGLITPAVDIWALGVTLYEAATGRLPFASFQDGRLPQLFESAPRAPVLTDLIARCLERDPTKRPASMAEIARVLRNDDGDRVTADIGSTTPSQRPAPIVSPPVVASPGVAKKRWPLVVAAAVGVVAIASALVVTREPAPPPTTTTKSPVAEEPVPPSSATGATGTASVEAQPPSPQDSASPATTVAPVTPSLTPPKHALTPPKHAVTPPKHVVTKQAITPKHTTPPRTKPRTTSQGETLD